MLFELGLAAVRGGAQSSGPSEQCCCYRHAIPADAEADAETARQAEAEAARQAAQAAAYFQAKAAAQPQVGPSRRERASGSFSVPLIRGWVRIVTGLKARFGERGVIENFGHC